MGCADRSCFDLTRHSKVTKVDMSAKVELPEPVRKTGYTCIYNWVIQLNHYK